MTTETTTGNSAEDQEAIHLARSRLVRVCRMNGQAAEQALVQAAAEQRAALVAVAMRILAASSRDLAAGRILNYGGEVKRAAHHGGSRRTKGPVGQKKSHKLPRDQRWKGKK